MSDTWSDTHKCAKYKSAGWYRHNVGNRKLTKRVVGNTVPVADSADASSMKNDMIQKVNEVSERKRTEPVDSQVIVKANTMMPRTCKTTKQVNKESHF